MVAGALGTPAPTAQAQNCAAPTSIRVTSPNDTTAAVSFAPVANALSYTIRYRRAGDSTAAGIVSQTVAAPPATLTGLRPRTTYFVNVTSNCASGDSATSAWVSFQTRGSTPVACAAPTNVRVTATNDSSAVVAFTPAGGALSYTVRYFAPRDSTNIRTLTVTDSLAVISDLRPNTLYVVHINTTCQSGAVSAPVRFTFRTSSATSPVICGGITNVLVTSTSASTATVSFTPGANNTSFYVAYQSGTDSVQWVNTNASSVTLTGFVPGLTYIIRVTSACGTGASTTYMAAAPVTYTFRGALGVRATLGAGTLQVFPSPAHGTVSLLLPAVVGATRAQLTLLNALGQQVRTLAVPLNGAETPVQFNLTDVVPGLYTLWVQAGGQRAGRRLVVE